MRVEPTCWSARPNKVAARPSQALPSDPFGAYPELIGSPLSYSREEGIYGEGEKSEFVYRIVAGAVRTCKILSDGRRQINGFYLPGDLFGLEEGETHLLTAEAIVDTKVTVIRQRQLKQLASSNVDIACQLWRMAAKSLQQADAHILLLGRRTALERLAAFLLRMEFRLGGTGSIELPMSRRDIADYLGLTLETVSRSMSQLQSNGAVTLSGARRLILDTAMLSALVES